jgi:hypothetical protein
MNSAMVVISQVWKAGLPPLLGDLQTNGGKPLFLTLEAITVFITRMTCGRERSSSPRLSF